MSGDLVVHPQPYGFGSFPTDWVKTLDALAALDYSCLVPGHGEVQTDTTYIRHLQKLIESVRTQAERTEWGSARAGLLRCIADVMHVTHPSGSTG